MKTEGSRLNAEGSGAEILVVDDQELMRLSLQETLEAAGYAVTTAADGQAALDLLDGHDFEVVVTDLRMPAVDGLELTRRLLERASATPVIVITAHGSIETAVEAMRRGAFDYVQKPFEPDEIELVVVRALEHRRLALENEALKRVSSGECPVTSDGSAAGLIPAGVPRRPTARLDFLPDSALGTRHSPLLRAGLVGSSGAMADLRRQIEQVAPSGATVLVHGESGSGKELVARAIHAAGPRRAEVFLCVNCAALSAGLLESELFGHERGAFTGADRMRLGRFELAHGGTLLLDEVSELDPGLQAKLLRVLQEGRFERVGSSTSRAADVRVIATTNRDLAEAVREGRFRRDLYFRLAVLPVRVPPLREHPEDIGELVGHFLQRYRGDARPSEAPGGARQAISVHPETIRLLERYAWPGNVRELENLIRRALVMGFGPEWRPEHVQAWLTGTGSAAPAEGHRCHSAECADAFAGLTLAEVERMVVMSALARHEGNRTRAAAHLGLSGRTLRDKLARWRAEGWSPPAHAQERRSA